MPDPNQYFEKFQNLPSLIREYLVSSEFSERNRQLVRKFRLEEVDKEDVYFNILDAVFFKEMAVKDLAGTAEKRLGLAPQQAKQFAIAFAGYQLLPAEDYLGDVSGLIKQWGGDPKKFPAERIIVRGVTVEELTSLVVQQLGLIFNPRLQKRLENIILSFLKGIRDEGETKQTLNQDIKVGGLGFAPEKAEEILDTIKTEREKVFLKDAAAPTIPAKEEATIVPPAPSSISPQSLKPIFAVEEEEVRGWTEKATDLKKTIKAGPDLLKKTIDEIISAGNIRFTSPAMEVKLRQTLDSCLRGLRDILETKERLLLPLNQGGLGLNKEQAERIANLIEGRLKEFQEKLGQEEKQKKVLWIEKGREMREKKSQEKQTAEQKILDKRWQEIVGKELVKKTMLKPTPAPVLPVIEKPLPKIEEKLAPAGKPVKKEIAPPPPLPRRLEDIKPPPSLISPVEELQELTLEDLRKLSKEPLAAKEKIKKKIDLLGAESLAKRNAGIQAWKKSALNQLYLALGEESLATSQPIAAIINKRLTAGKTTLTEQEFRAIMRLNQELRF